jgi:CRP-like cAMP-binding protein
MYPQYDIVRELAVGDSFGEIALINNARRTASIICKEDTLLAVLSK